jgi:23S rRNA G2445 N2-methylase RlmL
VDAQPRFSVTANFVGRRNYSTEEIKQALAAGITLGHGWRYEADDAVADLNVRLFIEHETAFVGVRLGQSPLHRRPYKQIQRPGSLKPPVAAAMLFLLGSGPGLKVLDPCCGAGTILIEAARTGATVEGGDVELAAVEAARRNAEHAGVKTTLHHWDVRRLPLSDASVDRIASNLPWDRQVSVDDSLADFYREMSREMERVLAPQGRMALLTTRPDLLVFDKLRCREEIEISLFGQRPILATFQA